jgi:16S rRNA (cytosine967-C5)-methyltransferase
VIERCEEGFPADKVLRELFRESRDLDPAYRGEVAEAVFRYFRWFGWLPQDSGNVEARLVQARELAERFEKFPQGFTDKDLKERAVPAWVWGEMKPDADWCRMLQSAPRLWLRSRLGQGNALASELGACVHGPESMPESLVYTGKEDLFRTAAFMEGRVDIQDLSSQAVGLMCGVRSGQHWWDVCAGEGGKSMHLAAMMGGRGVLWATDKAAWRLARLKTRAARAGVFNYQSAVWQSGDPVPFKVEMDGVLVDAPCSGLGTWQRNPHSRWTLRPEEVEELGKLQEKLLQDAAAKVKRGGRLVYSVCTLTRRETADVVWAFERSQKGFEPEDVQHPLEAARTGSRHWLKPWEEGANGMFVAVWRRRA